jgi:hypothetical protein
MSEGGEMAESDSPLEMQLSCTTLPPDASPTPRVRLDSEALLFSKFTAIDVGLEVPRIQLRILRRRSGELEYVRTLDRPETLMEGFLGHLRAILIPFPAAIVRLKHLAKVSPFSFIYLRTRNIL